MVRYVDESHLDERIVKSHRSRKLFTSNLINTEPSILSCSSTCMTKLRWRDLSMMPFYLSPHCHRCRVLRPSFPILFLFLISKSLAILVSNLRSPDMAVINSSFTFINTFLAPLKCPFGGSRLLSLTALSIFFTSASCVALNLRSKLHLSLLWGCSQQLWSLCFIIEKWKLTYGSP